MNPEEMDQKHQEGIKLMNTDEMSQDGAEILMELANLGHIDSIEQLVYLFLVQRDLDDAEKYLKFAEDPMVLSKLRFPFMVPPRDMALRLKKLS